MLIDMILFLVTAACLYTDITRRKIYNCVLFPAVLLAAGYHTWTGGMAGGWFSLRGLALGLALLLIPYFAGGIGAGDVKLLATIGSLKGPAFVLQAFLAGAIAGGVLALIYLLRDKRLPEVLRKTVTIFLLPAYPAGPGGAGRPPEEVKSTTIPYGAAIAAGTLAAYLVR
ncbi:MAG: A24 family peptidase [Firmicutes bacterium]|nr:A24 family peptidase [Bacillota bacterium]